MAAIDLGIDGLSDFEEIGSGGFATVYSAIESGTDRRVAVKVLSAIDDGGRRRFDRERLTMGRTTGHPNIVTLLRAGYTGNGNRPYLVLEYLAGGSLQELIDREGPLDWNEAAALIRPVAEALGFSHRSGIVHKDVKPANILLSSTGDVKLADFGIAAIVEATATSQASFSLHFAAPESFDIVRDPETDLVLDPRDERSDLYSLAATLYTLTVGQPPFNGPTPQVLMTQILRAEAPSVGHVGLDGFLATALAKDPDDRYPDAASFIDALDASTIDAPVVRPLTRSRPAPEVGRKPAPAQTGRRAVATDAVDEPVGGNDRRAWMVAAVALLAVVAGFVINRPAATPDDTDRATSEETFAVEQTTTATTWPGPGSGENEILSSDGVLIARYLPVGAAGELPDGATPRWTDVDVRMADGSNPTAEGFVVEVLKELEALPTELTGGPGLALTAGGVRIHTAYSEAAQTAAVEAIEGAGPLPGAGLDASLISLDTRTGAIRSIVGPGVDLAQPLVSTRWLPAGSAFRPMVLAAAYEDGWNPSDEVRSGSPCEFESSPEPHLIIGGDEPGATRTLSGALDGGQDCALARIGSVLGGENLAATAIRLGVVFEEPNTGLDELELPLGYHRVLPISLATATATLANDGSRNDAWTVDRIEYSGGVLYERSGTITVAVEADVARRATESLLAAFDEAVDGGELRAEHEVAGITGGETDNRWFIGSTTHLTTIVWIGEPTGESLLGTTFDDLDVTDLDRAATEMWLDYNTTMHRDLDPLPFGSPAASDGGRLLTAAAEIG